jgi:hypothetical protein
VDNAVPPVDAAYQSIVSPADTLADIDVLDEPKQVALETPDVGATIAGQLQSGAVTPKSVVQPFNVAVNVTFVPAVIPVTVLAVLSTTPEVEVTVPLLTKTIL